MAAAELWGTALLSGAVAAVVAIGVTRAIEKFGGIVGGVLGTTPTTIIPAALGLAHRLNADGLMGAMYAMPLGMLINAFFLLTWRVLPSKLPPSWGLGRQMAAMVGASLGVWAVGATIAATVNIQLLTQTGQRLAAGVFGTLGAFMVGFMACLQPMEAPKGTNPVSWRVLAARGAFAALSITVSILLSSVNGVLGGLTSTFPAIFLTSMVSVWLAQGRAVSTGASGPMILGSVSVAMYAMLFPTLVVRVGVNPWGATPVCWCLSVLGVSLPVTLFIRWRRSLAAKSEAAPAPRDATPPAVDAVWRGDDVQLTSGVPPQVWGDATFLDTGPALVDTTPITVPTRVDGEDGGREWGDATAAPSGVTAGEAWQGEGSR